LVLILFTRRRLGPWGSLAALIALGSSCGYVFYSRYFIHEIFFVLFTLGLYLCAVYYADTRRTGFFYSGAACMALLYATKETSVLIFVILATAALIAQHFSGSKLKDLIGKPPPWLHLFGALCVALLIWGLLYSSFFTNPNGLWDSIRTYATWTRTGVSGHTKAFPYFLTKLLWPYEKPLLLLSAVGAYWALKKRERGGLFLLFWSLGIVVVHGAIPYKTPWLIMNFLLPLALLAGYGVQKLIEHKNATLTSVVLVAALLLSLQQWPTTMKICFVEYDNETYPHIYAHTSRDVYRLVNDIEGLAKRSGLGQEITINIVSKTEWPLPFYLRKYRRAYFWRQFENVPDLSSPLIIAEADQHHGVAALVGESKYIVRPYKLRGGIPLEMWVRRDLLFYDGR
jgi:uncharacterized protein (TIGR03663 family)